MKASAVVDKHAWFSKQAFIPFISLNKRI